MARTHPLRRRLDDGEASTGIIVNFDAPWFVDLVGLSGFDFVMLDAEHGPITRHNVEPMIRAAEQADMTALVRVPANGAHIILGFLDAGAKAIQVPHIETADDIRRAVSAIRYPPLGARGMSTMTRAARYGAEQSAADYVEAANRDIVFVPMVETPAGVENIDRILDAGGIDILFIGTGDLAASMGLPGQRSAKPVLDAVRHVIDRATARRVPVGLPATDLASAKAARAAGASMLEIAVTGAIVQAGRSMVDALNPGR